MLIIISNHQCYVATTSPELVLWNSANLRHPVFHVKSISYIDIGVIKTIQYLRSVFFLCY